MVELTLNGEYCFVKYLKLEENYLNLFETCFALLEE